MLTEKFTPPYGGRVPKPTGVHALVRRTHEERVLHALRQHGALSRGALARVVGLSRSTLSEITSSLRARGAIVVVDTDAAARSGSGRPAERLALDPASGQYLGIDFGHRRVHVAVADAAHEIIADGVAHYDDAADWSVRRTVAVDLIDRLAAERGVHFGALQGIGIGVPGPFSGVTVPAESTDLPQRSMPEVVPFFVDRFRAPVTVDNNMRFAALAEAVAAGGRGAQDLLYIRLADGVGGGLVVGGRLVTGSSGFAGELGHARAVANGALCRCGKDGCLETIASLPAILAECSARGLAISTLDELGTAIERSHPIAADVIRDAGTAVGRIASAAAMALDPSEIVIAGDLVRVAPALVDQVAAVVRFEHAPHSETAPVVRAAVLDADAGALGAITALFHQSPLLAGYPDPAPTTPSGRNAS
jgi:predicted NBD/HSP70 family sugar kinase